MRRLGGVDAPTEEIVPEPTPEVRTAILEALREERGSDGGWAAAALCEGADVDAGQGAEGVSIPGGAPFQQHDVCSLW